MQSVLRAGCEGRWALSFNASYKLHSLVVILMSSLIWVASVTFDGAPVDRLLCVKRNTPNSLLALAEWNRLISKNMGESFCITWASKESKEDEKSGENTTHYWWHLIRCPFLPSTHLHRTQVSQVIHPFILPPTTRPPLAMRTSGTSVTVETKREKWNQDNFHT